ncbi:Protoheme IX farnesyltransferase, mitochondrial [Zalaria obscura]|uniref:Protoheme IX farnesyltransferase, mitochondrial n=1 Tax=Zalaria obscura TaxID=2024903 RepID=A0ACC3S5K3_9PEZI
MPFGPSPLLQLAIADTSSSLCLRCTRKLARSSLLSIRRNVSTTPVLRHGVAAGRAQDVDGRYFWGNDFRSGKSEKHSEARKSWQRLRAEGTKTISRRKDGIQIKATEKVSSTTFTSTVSLAQDDTDSNPVVRRRGRRKAPSNPDLPDLPLDASAQLSAIASSAPALSIRRRAAAYFALTKPRLAFLIVLTTTGAYSLYPVPSLLSTSATHTPSLSALTLLFLTTGTFATVACANTINMLLEPAHDAKMSRTRNRPLVRGLIKTRGAVGFAILSAVVGCGILYWGVNPTTAALGAGNIVLYGFIYTPLKRISILNTWVGAIVGAIPPLMGWCAAGGQYATSFASPSALAPTGLQGFLEESKALLFGEDAVGGWLLAALLFAWQFPHFNALSHPIRHEYFNAGYRMMVSYYPRLNTRVALRYSVLMFPICFGLTWCGVTDRGFVVTSSIINGWMLKEAWKFWRSGGGETAQAAKTARGLFWASVWHLPIVLVLAMVHKKGLWDGVWNGLVGTGEEEEWEDDE